MLLLWSGFIVLVVLMLLFDLCVLHREAAVIGLKQALAWSVIWTLVALVFNVGVYYVYKHDWMGIATRRVESELASEAGGHSAGEGQPQAQDERALAGDAATRPEIELENGALRATPAADNRIARLAAAEFFAGYVLERALSFDNLFVIAVIFTFFGIKAEHQHRVLFWGIFGALVMRGVMIAAATWLVHHLSWMTYVFGALLIVTAIKMLTTREESIEPDRNPLVRLARRIYPVTSQFHGPRFFVRESGRRAITPLFLALVAVETTDLLFAVDSIPAIIGVTRDTFIVFSSNIMAILGLRALYFALAGMMREFEYVKISLVVILAFVGVKMLIAFRWHINIWWSLGVIMAILAAGVIASWVSARRGKANSDDGAAGTPP
jgi:tellurite resistance protein TerC